MQVDTGAAKNLKNRQDGPLQAQHARSHMKKKSRSTIPAPDFTVDIEDEVTSSGDESVRFGSAPPRTKTSRAPKRKREVALELQRSKRRQSQAIDRPRVTSDPGRLSFLEARTVQAKTEKYYDKIFQELMRYCEAEDLPILTANELDRAATEFLDFAYEEGKRADYAEKLVASIQYYCPQLASSPKHALGRTRRAMKGFAKLAPHRSRVPLPWEWAAGIATIMVKEGSFEEALVLLLQFDSYARPSALLRLRGSDLIAPVAATGLDRWALVLAPQEREVATKTGTYDETVAIGNFDVDLTQLLAQKKRTTANGDLVFKTDAVKYRKAFSKAAKRLGLEQWCLTTYQARHGGATRDILLQRREMEEVRKRGHWKTYSSVRRYEKSGRVQRVLGETAPQVLTWCQEAAEKLPSTLRGSRGVGAPPAPGVQRSLLALRD